MAEVFRATRICAAGVECPVAIKRVRPEFAQQVEFVQMFIREAQLLSQLAHPNIVSVLGFERDVDGQLFLIMEHIDGVDLNALIDSGPLPHAVIVFIVAEMLSGLGYAHHLPEGKIGRGIVHRDLSPHNVLLSWEGAVKVADFGLAKLRHASHTSASRVLRGKPAFTSPEQANGRPLDGRSDLFSVGIMLWEMLTGRRLFWRDYEGATATICRVLTSSIPRPSSIRQVAPDLEAVVMRLLEQDPAHRYPSAEAARVALMSCDDAFAFGRIELERVLVKRFPAALARRAPPPMTTADSELRVRAEAAPHRARARWRRWAVLATVAIVLAGVGIGIAAGLIATR
jgi:serine/threonine-protein kinase